MPVTDDNKREFLNLVLRRAVVGAVEQQLVSFLRGFDEILPRSVVSVFDYQELQLLISGLGAFDVADWKRHTRYLGAFAKRGADHPVVKHFWAAVEAFDDEQRARLCQFATGRGAASTSGPSFDG